MSAGEKDSQTKKLILNEGELKKKSGIFKRWRLRFVVLSEEEISIFNRKDDESKAPKHSLPVTDISSIESYSSKKKSHCFRFSIENRSYIFCCPTELARDLWIRMIREAKERRKEPEEKTATTSSSNPTVTSTQLNQGLKEVRIKRQNGQGLGCTIKTLGGVTRVGRILEDGPVSTTGVLRPDDEIIEVNGIKVFGLSMAEIIKIIRTSPETVVVTIKPFDSKPTFKKTDIDDPKITYIHIDHERTAREAEERENNSSVSTPQDFGPAPKVPSRTQGHIKQPHADEYEDDKMAAALKQEAAVSEENDPATTNHGNDDGYSDTQMKPLEGDSEYINMNTENQEMSGKEITGNYILLDFSSTADDNEEPDGYDKDTATTKD